MTGSFARRCYEIVLLLYPKAYRRRFESEMIQCFDQLRREPRYRGFQGRARFWSRVLLDVSTNAALMRLSLRKKRRTQPRPRRNNMLESLWRELVFGARKLLRRPGFTMIAVVTIAVGIGANALVFTVVQGTLLNPLPYPEPERVVSVWPDHWFTRGELAYFGERAETMELAGALSDSIVYLGADEPVQLEGLHVSSSYFSVLQVPPVIGRTFEGTSSDASTVVLSFGLWQRLFGGEESILGETVILDDRPFRILGVMPRSFAPLPLGGELWLPMEMDPNVGRYEGVNEIQAIGRLSKHASPQQAMDELRRIVERRGRDFAHLYSEDFGKDVSLTPLHETVTSDFRKPLLVLQVAVVFVLLMACVNVANIALAGASTRATELALRSALGASRGQIVRQLTTEAALIAAMGSGVGLMTAFLCLPLIVSALPIEKPGWLTIAIDGKVLLFTAALALLSVVAFGLLPALWSSKATSQPRLKTGKSVSSGSVRLRTFLVASEMALAVILIVGAGLMLKSFLAVLEEDLGFTTERVVTMRLHPSPADYREPERNRIFYREVLERIRALPGIDEAGIARRLPLQGAWFTRLHVEGIPSTNDRGHAVQWTPADPGYFRTLRLDVVEGRGFDGSEHADTQPVALVNETFATRLWQNVTPIGRRVRFTASEDEWMTVVGVVRDVKQNGPRGFAFPMIFRPFEQSPIRSMRMVVRTTGDALAASASIRGAIWEIDPSVPISEVSTMEQILSRSLAEPGLPVLGLAVFAAIALLLGTGGLYGVVSYVASQRTYDIGVLFALGAQQGHVLRAVMSAGMRPVFIGMMVGLAGSLVLSRFIASLLFEVSPTDPMVLASVTAVLTLAALVACYVPARRASRVDPITALRSE